MKKNLPICLMLTLMLGLWSIESNAQSSSALNTFNAAYYLGWSTSNALPFKINGTQLMTLGTAGDLNLNTSTSTYQIGGNKVLWHDGTTSDIFVGVNAGNSTMSGHLNTLVGYNAGNSLTSSQKNTFVGYEAGKSATAVYNAGDPGNVAIGYQSLYSNDDMLYNTAVGHQALFSSNSCPLCWDGHSTLNTAIGYQALYTSQGYGGCAVGFQAGYSNTDGCGTLAIGEEALKNNTTGDYNVAVGAIALHGNTSLNYNVAVGSYALQTQSYNGDVASYNTAVGTAALSQNQPTSTTNGINNTALGGYALYANTTGKNNVGIGYDAGYTNQTGSYNTNVGYAAGYLNATSYGTFVGYAAGENSTGLYNTFVGYIAGNATTTGGANTFVGLDAGYNNVESNNNTGVGLQALGQTVGVVATDVGNNTALGYKAGWANTTGTGNTFVGYLADASGAAFTNATAIGNGASTSATNKVRIGNTAVTVIEGQVAWTWPSDARFKENVSEKDVQGLDFILKLRPVSYNFNRLSFAKHINENTEGREKELQELSKIRSTGFLAQEVEKTIKETGYTSFDAVHAPTNENDNYGLAYAEFVVPLVKAIQELDAKNKELQTQITALKDNVRIPDNSSRTAIDVTLLSGSIVLLQNQPNPFKEQTTITYFIPEDSKDVKIIFTDSRGTVLKEVEIAQTGNGQLNVYAQDLSSGIYTYTLIADGVTIDSKKMVCNK
ncbi:MAG TPA: tail fiber domain-containing protein [Bacteroidia bacterium]|nr:tail fiber domain-containing protein [Bacteroidia bacterium]